MSFDEQRKEGAVLADVTVVLVLPGLGWAVAVPNQCDYRTERLGFRLGAQDAVLCGIVQYRTAEESKALVKKRLAVQPVRSRVHSQRL